MVSATRRRRERNAENEPAVDDLGPTPRTELTVRHDVVDPMFGDHLTDRPGHLRRIHVLHDLFAWRGLAVDMVRVTAGRPARHPAV